MLNPNFNFNTFGNREEQNLVQDLIDESIQIFGMEIFYIPKTLTNGLDLIFGEDPTEKFEGGFNIEMYMEGSEGFDGEKFFAMQTGYSSPKNTSFLVSQRRFALEANQETRTVVQSEQNDWDQNVFSESTAGLIFAKEIPTIQDIRFRPKVGDLLWIPLTRECYEITIADHEAIFYEFGKVFLWRLNVEKHKYSSARINTGNPDVDAIQTNYSQDITNDPERNILDDTTELKDEFQEIMDPFENDDPFSDGFLLES